MNKEEFTEEKLQELRGSNVFWRVIMDKLTEETEGFILMWAKSVINSAYEAGAAAERGSTVALVKQLREALHGVEMEIQAVDIIDHFCRHILHPEIKCDTHAEKIS